MKFNIWHIVLAAVVSLVSGDIINSIFYKEKQCPAPIVKTEYLSTCIMPDNPNQSFLDKCYSVVAEQKAQINSCYQAIEILKQKVDR
jgi:hypothetical protein